MYLDHIKKEKRVDIKGISLSVYAQGKRIFEDASPYPTEGEAYIHDDRSFHMMRCNMKTIIRCVGQVRRSHACPLSSFNKFSHHPELRCLIALKIFSSVSPCDACFLYDSPPKFW